MACTTYILRLLCVKEYIALNKFQTVEEFRAKLALRDLLVETLRKPVCCLPRLATLGTLHTTNVMCGRRDKSLFKTTLKIRTTARNKWTTLDDNLVYTM